MVVRGRIANQERNTYFRIESVLKICADIENQPVTAGRERNVRRQERGTAAICIGGLRRCLALVVEQAHAHVRGGPARGCIEHVCRDSTHSFKSLSRRRCIILDCSQAAI